MLTVLKITFFVNARLGVILPARACYRVLHCCPFYMGSVRMQACDVGLPAPDAVVYLSLPVDVAEQRGGFGEERYETRQMQTEVGRRFNELNDGTWHVIDASLPLEDVQKQVRPCCSPISDDVLFFRMLPRVARQMSADLVSLSNPILFNSSVSTWLEMV